MCVEYSKLNKDVLRPLYTRFPSLKQDAPRLPIERNLREQTYFDKLYASQQQYGAFVVTV